MSNSNVKDIIRLSGKLILFFLPIALLAYPLDVYLVNKQKENPGEEIQIWNDLYNGKINSDIVIYGASRASEIIDPIIIQDSLNTTAYNLGINGHNFFLEHLRHQLLFQHNRKPKAIIVSLDLTFLAKRPDLYQDEQFLPFMLWNKEVKNYINCYDGYAWPDYYIPSIRYYGKGPVIYNFLTAKISARNRGYQGQTYINYDNEPYNHKQMVKIDAGTLKLFDNFLAECKRLNVKVIMVYTPEYFPDRNLVLNRSEVLNHFWRYSKKYHVPFFDYSEDSLSFKKKYFWNMEHLNAKGSAIFTRNLIDTFKKTHVLDSALHQTSVAK